MVTTIWSREDPRSFCIAAAGDNTSTPLASTNVVLCWFKGMVFLAVLFPRSYTCYLVLFISLANCACRNIPTY